MQEIRYKENARSRRTTLTIHDGEPIQIELFDANVIQAFAVDIPEHRFDIR